LKPQDLEEELSDEQLVVYLEAASDRLTRDAHAEFGLAVEAARLGTVFASNVRAYSRWRTQFRPKTRPAPLSDAQLEAAIMNAQAHFPGAISRATIQRS